MCRRASKKRSYLPTTTTDVSMSIESTPAPTGKKCLAGPVPTRYAPQVPTDPPFLTPTNQSPHRSVCTASLPPLHLSTTTSKTASPTADHATPPTSRKSPVTASETPPVRAHPSPYIQISSSASSMAANITHRIDGAFHTFCVMCVGAVILSVACG